MSGGERRRYPSDLTDVQWEIISELIPRPRKSRKGGRPRSVDMREVLNTIFYQGRSGCQWNMIRHDLLPKSTVYDYFTKWREDGTLGKINDRLVGAIRMLEAPSEEMNPSAGSIDNQSVKTSERSGSRDYDGGKKITGRKRNIAVDTLGLLLAVTVASMPALTVLERAIALGMSRLAREIDGCSVLLWKAPTEPLKKSFILVREIRSCGYSARVN